MAKVVIVGAGPAGAATALLLARNRIEVDLVEQANDFARVFRGEGLMPSGLSILHQMGLGAKIDALPGRPIETWELYLDRHHTMSVPEPSRALGSLGLRVVAQSRLLELLIEEASRFPGFRFHRGSVVRALVHDEGRVVGVATGRGSAAKEMRGDLVIGADGRGSTVRKRAALDLRLQPEAFDIAWFKVPLPEALDGRSPMLLCASGADAVAAYVSWDDRLQVAAAFRKGEWKAVREGDWLASCLRAVPDWLAEHVRAHERDIDGPIPLDVIVGRCPEWGTPGLLLLGDAAHPMSPIRAQGINLALRDAAVAANHLVRRRRPADPWTGGTRSGWRSPFLAASG